MNIATQVRQEAIRSGTPLRDMCEQEYVCKDVNSANRTVQFKFSDGSTVDMLATADDME